eukprot:2360538-Rhodomonas_salina.1
MRGPDLGYAATPLRGTESGYAATPLQSAATRRVVLRSELRDGHGRGPSPCIEVRTSSAAGPSNLRVGAQRQSATNFRVPASLLYPRGLRVPA